MGRALRANAHRKDDAMKIRRNMMMGSLVMAGLFAMSGMWASADAALVTQVEFTRGGANLSGDQGQLLDRQLQQPGTLKVGQYQSWGSIGSPIEQDGKTYSLFTSDLLGEEAPWATIDGMSITMDLNALFFGWKSGDEFHIWNIGGMAKGLFNPQTSEFQLSWDHLLNGSQAGAKAGPAGTYFLQGLAVVGAPAAVPIAASGVLFGSGLIGLGSWSWLKRRGQGLQAA
jgi:hypothetical protein